MGLGYTEKVMEHFKSPHNMGEIKNPDGVGKVGNPVCGDVMKIYIKVRRYKGKEVIGDIKFQTYGCVSAIATTSMMTKLAKGKDLDAALKISRNDVANALGGLPPIKMHCSHLATEALEAAIKDYRKTGKKKAK
ncbi:MAG: iron-sulfur cluster assembly scaffold protein [Candidatus Aenigmatarchaeota archaeon]|nr:MAG: iron-sulfur cluster assembly scaffold protein [Candidatus Aenigmarchaeota archaeon]